MDTSHLGFINQAAVVRRGQLQPIRGQCCAALTNQRPGYERAETLGLSGTSPSRTAKPLHYPDTPEAFQHPGNCSDAGDTIW